MATNPGDIIRVACRHLFEGVDEQINVFHFTVEDGPAVPEDGALLADISTFVSDAYLNIDNYMSSAVAAQDITVYNVTDDYPLGVVGWSNGYVGGLAVGDGLPPGVAALYLWRTAVKRVLGKTYLPTFAESTQNRGSLDSTTRTAMSDFGTDLKTITVQPNEYSFLLGVWSREAGQMRPIVSHAPGLKVGYQRRRKAGVGS